MTIGPNGPVLLQDTQFLDVMTHFDRERIPERVVHAKGGGAFGYLEVTHDITKYCKAKVFEKIGKRTPCAVRFSTVGKYYPLAFIKHYCQILYDGQKLIRLNYSFN